MDGERGWPRSPFAERGRAPHRGPPPGTILALPLRQPMRERVKSVLAALARRRGPLRSAILAMARSERRRGTAGVAAVLFDGDGRVLLLEHVFWPERRWGLPGGWARRGEDPAEAIRREVREELGLEVSIERPVLDEETSGRHGFAFLCGAAPDAPLRLSLEIASARWFPLDELPPDLVSFHRKAIDAAAGARA